MTDVRITRNDSRQRFEAYVGDEFAGYADYFLRDGVYVFPHTVVEERFGGRGVGTTLVRAALDEVSAEDARILPACSFVAAFVERNPDYRRLLAGNHEEDPA